MAKMSSLFSGKMESRNIWNSVSAFFRAFMDFRSVWKTHSQTSLMGRQRERRRLLQWDIPVVGDLWLSQQWCPGFRILETRIFQNHGFPDWIKIQDIQFYRIFHSHTPLFSSSQMHSSPSLSYFPSV